MRPIWIDIALAGVCVILALWLIGRRQSGRPVHSQSAEIDYLLLILGCVWASAAVLSWPDPLLNHMSDQVEAELIAEAASRP